MHRKLIAVDGRTVIMGGRNFADHYRGDRWRDVDLVLEGPSAAPLADLFDQVWSATDEKGDVLPESPVPRARLPWVDYTPAAILEDPMMCYTLASIHAAEKTVDIELAYLAAQEVLCAALEAALRRGVRVRVLTNSAESNDMPFSTYTAHLGMRRLGGAGAKEGV